MTIITCQCVEVVTLVRQGLEEAIVEAKRGHQVLEQLQGLFNLAREAERDCWRLHGRPGPAKVTKMEINTDVGGGQSFFSFVRSCPNVYLMQSDRADVPEAVNELDSGAAAEA